VPGISHWVVDQVPDLAATEIIARTNPESLGYAPRS
jgi:hypothetical protein